MAAGRHAAKHKKGAVRRYAPGAAAVTLAGTAAAFMTLPGGGAPAHRNAPDEAALTSKDAVTGFTTDLAGGQLTSSVHRAVAALHSRKLEEASRAAARHRAEVRQRAAAAAAAAAAARQAAAQPSTPAAAPSPAASTPPPVSGGDAAQSALGVCIRNAEEGGSYVWGPGNGGGAYQFTLGTWEAYGGAASEYGVAGPAYQDQIFDNAIAAGGASNWTNYDGC